MAAFIGNLGEYKEAQEDFESYLERFEQWMIVNEVDDIKQANIFLSVIGAEAYGLSKNLCIPDKRSSLSYGVLSGKLTAHYKPKPLVIAERFKFQKRNQQENESVSDYVVALKHLSTHCDFGRHLDEALRDRFVSGLKVEAIQRKFNLRRCVITFKNKHGSSEWWQHGWGSRLKSLNPNSQFKSMGLF
uniref:Retrotransposon gag domain-containing protein n=1 Tax=Nothobranchius furzeri TaxID=105023 RepID=A0A8C6VV85_NOTFU